LATERVNALPATRWKKIKAGQIEPLDRH